jgi:chromate transporter
MSAPNHPSLSEATRVWVRIAALSFGGPAGQIAVMHRILVEEKRWLGDARFLHALNFCMVLPGPEAQQLATYIGWLLHGVRGGLIAGILFILPGALAILGLSIVYVLWGDVGLVGAVFFGLKAAVLAIVVQALWRVAKRALTTRTKWGIAIAAFIAIFAFAVPFPVVVAVAAFTGFVGARASWAGFTPSGSPNAAKNAASSVETVLGDADIALTSENRKTTLIAGVVALAFWLLPVAFLAQSGVFADIATFFARMAVVTFGGAYAVLAYVAQEAVGNFGWLAPGEMLDGLALAETTPGPLIMVLQYVGFLAAYRDPGALSPMTAGLYGAALTTWVTFAPCFAWIFLGGPWMERLRQNTQLTAALAAVTAAVVGVIANLAIWFGLHILFAETMSIVAGPVQLTLPDLASIQPAALVLTLLAMAGVFWARLGVVTLLLLAATAGFGAYWLGLN